MYPPEERLRACAAMLASLSLIGSNPPRVAFPTLPLLGPVPLFVDPDGWLQAVHARRYARKVKRDGTVLVAEQRYYVTTALAGQYIVLEVDAPTREFVVWQRQEVVKRLPIKGLQKTLLAFDDFVDQLCREAHTQGLQRRA